VVVTLAAGAGYAMGSPGSATVILTSDDTVGQTVNVTASDATANEAGLTSGSFTFARTGAQPAR